MFSRKTRNTYIFHSSSKKMTVSFCVVSTLQHGAIMRTGITCKKIPCYMGDSACRWFIVKKAKIF